MKRLFAGLLTLSLLLLAVHTELFAQSRTGTILGTVTDATGAVIPGAKVTVTNMGTNQARETSTDANGRYVVTLLPVGRYSIKVNATGFGEGVSSDLVLEVQANLTVDFSLSPAAVGEVIEVTGNVLQVDTTTATLGQVIHQQQVEDLPLNGRNFVQLGWLAPGVTKGEGTFLNNRGNTEVSIRGSVSLSVQGMRENTNDWLLDGVDNNELTAGAISILPSVEGIQEFKVLTFNYSAEYGSRSSATILVVTKGGSNAFHGTVFEFFRNDKLDARNFFDRIPAPAKLRQNQFGGSIGGPIKSDRAFFFFNYEGTRVHQGLTGFATVPTVAMHGGDFSEGFNGTIFDPCPTFDVVNGTCPGGFLPPASRPAFAGNIIPANRIDPIGLALINLYPSPNAPSQIANRLSNNFASNPIRTFDDDQIAFRIDFKLSDKDQIFGRFNYDDASQFFPTFCPGFCSSGSVAASSEDFVTEARNVAVQWQRTFTPTIVNQLMAGYNRVFNTMTSFAHRPENQNLPTALGIPGANLGDFETSGMTNIGVSGLNRLGSRLFTPFVGGTNVFHFSDSLMVIRGAHAMKMGASARLMQMPVIGNTWFHGNFNFDGVYTRGATGGTGSAIADLLLGLPHSASRNDHFQGFLNGRRWEEYRFFFEDSWRVNPKLTLTLGLGYNVTTPQREDNNRFTNFDPATGNYLVAGVNAGRSAGVETDWNNLEPRLGFAWTPWSHKTVIRGGYGIFTDVSANGGVQGLYMNPPFAAALSLNTNGITPVDQITGTPVTLAAGFPIQTAPNLATYTGALVLTQLDFDQGFVQQWNLNIEHELPGNIVATIAYAGTRATKLQSKGWNLNAGLPGAVPNPATRPFPTLGAFNAILSRGELSYNALILRAEKRFSHGLFFLANYTWSKGLSNGPGQNIGVNQGARYFPLPKSLVGENADKAPSDTDLRHQFSLSYLYDLPVGRNRTFLSDMNGIGEALLGGWQISGITRIRGGFPLAMSTGFFDTANAGVGNRPDRICHGSGDGSIARFFDTSCFPLVFARMGNAARAVLSGPDQVNFDFSLLKTIPLREPMRMEFRTEFFNIFNHAQFDVPDTNASSGTFGTISSTINTSRQIQFALKFIF